MEKETINKLESIVGKNFSYKGKNIEILKYKPVGGTNVVIFMPSPKNFLESELENFFDELGSPLEEELKLNQVAIPEKKLQVFEPTKENETVKATLLETLQKVKEDKNYIPQAQAICGIVNQIVSVQKTEIQMIDLANKINN